MEQQIVPDRCEIAIDIRTTPLISKSYLDSFLEEIINELKDKDKEFKAKIQYITGQEAFLIDKNNILIKSLLNVLEKYKIKTELTISGPAHTGNLFAKYGISSIIWGPKGDNFHMPDEFVEIDSIAKTVQIYVETVIKYFENRKTF